MTKVSQMDLNSIRETVSNHITTAAKLSHYSNKVNDPELKQMLKNASLQAEQGAQKLIQML